MNIIKANLEYEHAPNFAEYHHPGTGADYTTTADVGADLDSTNFALTITTYGDPRLEIRDVHNVCVWSTDHTLVGIKRDAWLRDDVPPRRPKQRR